ncbi:hypothetical protein [Comamonas koreensis]|uniref:hypothetical protein n=1 Tax=Comamonas koreensis TaxID=160825 RepID=UPI0015FAE314|nr:hypothetical protein [Comamonas koreensis]
MSDANSEMSKVPGAELIPLSALLSLSSGFYDGRWIDGDSMAALVEECVRMAAPPPPEREPLTDDGRYTITIEQGAAQARFVITEMQIESAPSPAEYVGHAVSKAIAAIDKRRVSHGIGSTNG